MTQAEIDAAIERKRTARYLRVLARSRRIAEYIANYTLRLRHAELIARDG